MVHWSTEQYESQDARCSTMVVLGLVLRPPPRDSIKEWSHKQALQGDRRDVALTLLPLR